MTTAAARPRVMAIHAHPDDIEFQCAGTLALLGRRGCHVTLATMTAGDCGSFDLDGEAAAEVRRAEARAAAALIDAEYVCLGFRDMAIFNDDESRRGVTEAIRRARPDLILTAPPHDYHPDHEATSLLVRDACFAATLPNYKTRRWEPAPPIGAIPHLYFVDTLGGVDRSGAEVVGGFLVDVSEVADLKRSMLAAHASQREWLLRKHGIDEYLDAQADWDRRRGEKIGARAAERFRQYVGHPYPLDNRLLAWLGLGPDGPEGLPVA